MEQTPTIREQIKSLEWEIFEQKKKLAALYQSATGEPVEDYRLTATDGKTVKLSELFGDFEELAVIFNMGERCPYCTLWADGFKGFSDHLSNRCAFVLVSPDTPEVQARFAESRGWTFPTYSHQGSSFALDMGYAREDGAVLPGMVIFTKGESRQVLKFNQTSFGPGDNFCQIWDVMYMLPKGVNGWQPKYSY